MARRWHLSRPVWWVGGTALVLLIGLVVWLIGGSSQQAARAREYKDQLFCLLTPPAGLADPTAAQAWAGLEDVSAKTRVQVRYLAVAGVDSPGADGPFLASLAGEHCQGIVVSGAAEAQAAETAAPRFPQVEFFLLGHYATRGNLSGISYQGTGTIRSDVADALGRLVSG